MGTYMGGSAPAMARQICDGYILLSPVICKRLDIKQMETLEFEMDKRLREARSRAHGPRRSGESEGAQPAAVEDRERAADAAPRDAAASDGPPVVPTCSSGWEALRGDCLPWLLDESRPNLNWRVLVELVGRPGDSPAVRRARGAASTAGPVASLLAELHPDGSWATATAPWVRYAGPGWRMVAAMAWGADPSDPRLQAAAERVLESDAGSGGFAAGDGKPPSPIVTARLVQALVALGFGRHLRCQEALAWLEESSAAWSGDPRRRTVVAAAVAAALADRPELRRAGLLDRAAATLVEALPRRDLASSRLGFPNLSRTDLGEMLWALARAGAPFDPRMGGALRRLQRLQGEGGRWRRRWPRPASLPIPDKARGRVGEACRWISPPVHRRDDRVRCRRRPAEAVPPAAEPTGTGWRADLISSEISRFSRPLVNVLFSKVTVK